MNYYNKNYYPTPVQMIEEMLSHLDAAELKKMNVLEPSAGMGAICDYLRHRVKSISCIEIEPNFQETLKGKGYTVLHDDFFTYSGAKNFDLIVMNPPFDRGDAHLLKAYEIMRGGHIVCLLNAETLKSPHTKNRQELLRLIDYHKGTIQYFEGAFEGADRKTGVEVGMVKIYKPTVDERLFGGFETTAQKQKADIDFSSDETGVARRDYIGALIGAYQNAISATEELYTAMRKVSLYVSAFGHIEQGGFRGDKSYMEVFFEAAKDGKFADAHNGFQNSLQKAAWNKIFTDTNATKFATKSVKEGFEKWREQQGGVDLNEQNVLSFFDMLFSQKSNIRAMCIGDAFDVITRYSEKNRVLFGEETWKTNSHYMVGKKFILWGVDEWGMLDWSRSEKFDDIDRALSLVSGKPYDQVKKASEVVRAWLKDNKTPLESEFFKMKVYKKGSIHFEFLDDDLRMMFNREACAGKQWQLPEREKFGKKNRRA